MDSPGSNVMKAKAWKSAATAAVSSKINKKRSLLDDFDDSDNSDDDDDNNAARPLMQRRRQQQSTATRAGVDEIMPMAPDSQLLYFSSRPHLSTWQQRYTTSRTTMLSRPVSGQATRSMTLGDGTRVFMRVRQQQEEATTVRNRNSNSNQHCAVLGISMADLMARVQRMRRLQQHEKQHYQQRHHAHPAAVGTSSLRAVHEDDADDDDDDSAMDTPPTTTSPTTTRVARTITPAPTPATSSDNQLWVDKHAPASFLHLLSNEKTNREVIRALRAWDKYVFHKEPPSRPDFFQNNHNNNATKTSSPSDNKAKRNKDKHQHQHQQHHQHHQHPYRSKFSSIQNPKDTRPDASSRVLLLSGPPGVGKSTLAHIVARHCGYRPLEVNGSDERSASVLQDRVTRAMESHTLDNMSCSANGGCSSSRPNCLILDEIDGADANGAIQALVALIRAERPVSSDKTTSHESGKNNKKSGSRKKKIVYLRRPIIFICNNKFAPALQPLLPYCRQFHVNPPSSTRLVARLRAVLSMEGVSVSSSGRGNSSSSSSNAGALLHQLVATSGGDIRSCLYTLQFAAAKAKRMAMSNQRSSKLGKEAVVDISETLAASLTGKGLKDARSDIFGVVSSIFCNNRARGRDKNGRSSCDGILDLLQCFGDNARTLDCLFLNVMNVSYIDPTMDKCAAAHEWLSSADTHRPHDGVESSAAAAVHLLCRVEQQRQLDLVFSTSIMSQARYDREANQALAMRFIQGLDPQAARCTRCATSLVAVETTPYALWILSAGNAPGCLDRAASNVDLLNVRERMAFDSHVAVLSALGLTYVADENQYEATSSITDRRKLPDKVRLEPPIANFIQFQDLTTGGDRRDIPPQLKALLAQTAAHDKLQKRRADVDAKNDDLAKTSQAAGGTADGKEPAAHRESPNKRTAWALPLNNSKLPPVKKQKTTEAALTSSTAITSANFLGVGARKAKEARTAQKMARAGFQRSNKNKFSHTGSGVPLRQAMRLKYVKGFTQAVRVPCRLEDLA
jgi:chromosome transmission fidelity protein 18